MLYVTGSYNRVNGYFKMHDRTLEEHLITIKWADIRSFTLKDRGDKMTKKEMVYEMLNNTKISNVNERELINRINRTKRERIEMVYNEFLKDKEHARFYFYVF